MKRKKEPAKLQCAWCQEKVVPRECKCRECSRSSRRYWYCSSCGSLNDFISELENEADRFVKENAVSVLAFSFDQTQQKIPSSSKR